MHMEDKCKNKECVLHLAEVHDPMCVKAGSNRCTNILHNKICWSAYEKKLLFKSLDNYVPYEAGQGIS